MKKTIPLCLLLTVAVFAQGQLNKEQQQIRQTFFSFLKFYQKNETAFNRFDLYSGTGKDEAPPYHINWKEAEKYFAYLRKSVPFVGEAYITAEREHFRFSDSCFKADPEEEMPAGFDYDRWAGGQESIDYTIKWYTDPKNTYEVIITGNKALLRIGSALSPGDKPEDRSWSVVPFVKEKGKWKMADNVYPEFDEESPEN
ncbi:MAG: hypothetical protein J0M10_04925 [Chitinophagales bacterium]|nr:hypothetical protein [Chitinophagales bacterium]